MTGLPIPKYAIGDVVYLPAIDWITDTLPCPDCHGTRTWKATSPAGEEHTIACPRCTDQYARSSRNDLPSLKVTRHTPRAKRLTIGSITVKTHPYKPQEAVEYMANETGIGSGSLYYETNLFPDEASALAKAEVDASLKNAEVNATPAVTSARKFSGLTYTDAAITALKDGIFNSWQAFRSLGYAIESALPEDSSNDTEDQAAIREAVERYGRYGGTYLPIERHPIDAIFEACRSMTIDETVLRVALGNLKRIAGFTDKPEDPPCTCEFIGSPSFSKPDCPRHGDKG